MCNQNLKVKRNKIIYTIDPINKYLYIYSNKNHIFSDKISEGALYVMKVSQPLLAPLDHLANFHFLAKVTSANPSHSAMLMVSSSHPRPYSS